MQNLKHSSKRFSLVLLSTAIILSLTACGQEGSGSRPTKVTPNNHSNFFGKEIGFGFAGVYNLNCEYSYFDKGNPIKKPSKHTLIIDDSGKAIFDNEVIFENTKSGSMTALANPKKKIALATLSFATLNPASNIDSVTIYNDTNDLVVQYKGKKGREDCPILPKQPKYYQKNLVSILKARMPKEKTIQKCTVKTKNAENDYSISSRDMIIKVLDNGSIKVDDSIFPASLYPKSEINISTNIVQLKNGKYWGYRYTISDEGSSQRTVTLEFDAANDLIYAYRRDKDANVQYTCD